MPGCLRKAVCCGGRVAALVGHSSLCSVHKQRGSAHATLDLLPEGLSTNLLLLLQQQAASMAVAGCDGMVCTWGLGGAWLSGLPASDVSGQPSACVEPAVS